MEHGVSHPPTPPGPLPLKTSSMRCQWEASSSDGSDAMVFTCAREDETRIDLFCPQKFAVSVSTPNDYC